MAGVLGIALASYLVGAEPPMQPAFPEIEHSDTTTSTSQTIEDAPLVDRGGLVGTPNVIGLSAERAVEIFVSNGLQEDQITVEIRASLRDEGTVVAQDPDPSAPLDGAVVVFVAGPLAAPDFVGMSIGDVEAIAADLGAELVVDYQYATGVAENEVWQQSPAPGDVVTGSVTVAVGTQQGWIYLWEMDEVDDSGCSNASRNVNGEEYEWSVRCRTRASSSARFIEYDLGRDFEQLIGVVGLSDDSDDDVSVQFTITVDGEVLFDEVLTFGTSLEFNLDVTNGLRLRIDALAVLPEGDNTYVDAVIGNGYLLGDPEAAEDKR